MRAMLNSTSPAVYWYIPRCRCTSYHKHVVKDCKIHNIEGILLQNFNRKIISKRWSLKFLNWKSFGMVGSATFLGWECNCSNLHSISFSTCPIYSGFLPAFPLTHISEESQNTQISEPLKIYSKILNLWGVILKISWSPLPPRKYFIWYMVHSYIASTLLISKQIFLKATKATIFTFSDYQGSGGVC